MDSQHNYVPLEALDTLFPFHLILDGGMHLVQVGHSLSKATPGIKTGDDFASHFELMRPAHQGATFDTLSATPNAPVVFRIRANNLVLRSQLVKLPGESRLLMAASPALSADTLSSTGLMVSDFALYDYTLDYLLAIQTTRSSLEDSRTLTQQLQTERKRLEEAVAELEASREKYRLVVENVREVIFATDLEDHIVYLNPFWEELTGFSIDECIGTHMLSYVHQDDMELSSRLLQTLKAGRLANGRHQIRILTRNGEFKWCEALLRLTYYNSHGSVGLTGSLNDVTERRMAEFKLQDSEVRLRSIVATAAEAIIVTDQDGVIEEFNPAAERMFGYTFLEVKGTNLSRMLPETASNVSALERFLAQDCEVAMATEQEEYAIHKDGMPISVEVSISEMNIGNDLKYAAFVRDITLRKQVEQVRQESERQERQTRERLGFLHEIGISLSVIETEDNMCRRAVELGREWLGVDRLSLWFYDPESNVMRGTFGTDEKGNTRDERNQQYDAGADHRYNTRSHDHVTVRPRVTVYQGDGVIRDQVFQEIGRGDSCEVILWDGRRAIGTLFADNFLTGRQITPSDLDILELYGETIGHLYSRIQIQKQLKTNVEALAQSHQLNAEIGGHIQKSLLGASVPAGLDRVKVSTISLPSQNVDGDFVDFIRHDDTTFDVLIADVMGKGVPAALLSAAVKAQFESVVRGLCADLKSFNRLPEPGEIINAVNSAVYTDLRALQSFVTICYARINTQDLTLTLVDCGHPPAILFHPIAGNCEMMHGNNCPLGFLENDVYSQKVYHINPGDVVVFYSDGVTELKNENGDLWGEDRLLEVIRKTDVMTASEIAQNILKSAAEFRGSALQSDDLTAVVLSIDADNGTLQVQHRECREFSSNLANLEEVREFIRTSTKKSLDDDSVATLVLAVNEAVVNIMRHAYSDDPACRIQCSVDIFSDRVRIRLQDTGRGFDPAIAQPPSFDGSRTSGFGLYLIDHLVDTISRSHDEYGHNIVELIKKRAE